VPHPTAPNAPARWVSGILVIFTLMGLGFGSWLSRIPAVRDHLGASTVEMSLLGLTLAAGSVTGLLLSGRSVAWLGPRRALSIGIVVQLLAMPVASVLLWIGAVPAAVVCLAIFGFAFSTCDVAMNVSGANAERALDRPRMPLLHAGYSLGSVAAMGIGALAEAAAIPVPVHLSVMFALITAGVFAALLPVPRDEDAHAVDRDPLPGGAPNTHTGPMRVVPADAPAEARPGRTRAYSPWRDPRILLIGGIALSAGLAEGAASDWLPLALADGRELSNQSATLMLGAFFVAMMLTRAAGSWLLVRFGRVATLRGGGILLAIGIASVILIPTAWGALLGALLWGVGGALGFPVAVSASADDPAKAVRSVAAVAAMSYTAFLLGPMLFGFLGERFGLLPSFWPLIAFAVFAVVAAPAAREPGRRS